MYAAGFIVKRNILLCFSGIGDIVDGAVNDWLYQTIPDMAKAAGITEEPKVRDLILRVGSLIFQRPEGTPLRPLTISQKFFKHVQPQERFVEYMGEGPHQNLMEAK